jgi:hypothetical protein
MKKLLKITSIFTMLTCFCFGCKTIPSIDQMYMTSYAVGAAAAKVANLNDVSESTAKNIEKTLNDVKIYVPSTNETFTSKWMPLISVSLSNQIKKNELTLAEAALAEKIFKVVCNGMDFIIKERYEISNTYSELVSTAIYGFSSGFLTYFSKSPTTVAAQPKTTYYCSKKEFTKAYEYLMQCKY